MSINGQRSFSAEEEILQLVEQKIMTRQEEISKELMSAL